MQGNSSGNNHFTFIFWKTTCIALLLLQARHSAGFSLVAPVLLLTFSECHFELQVSSFGIPAVILNF